MSDKQWCYIDLAAMQNEMYAPMWLVETISHQQSQVPPMFINRPTGVS